MSVPPPAGARCSRHPDADATAICTRCGDFACAACTIVADGAAYCTKCEAHAGEPFPWERRKELGVLRAIALTMKASVLDPHAFARGFRDRSVLAALAFGLLIAWPIGLAQHVVALVWPPPPPEPTVVGLEWMFTDAFQIAAAIGVPIVFVVAIYAEAGAWWIGLRVARAGRPFAQVVRAVAYVRGSLAPLDLVWLLPESARASAFLAVGLFGLVVQARALRALAGADALRMIAASAVMILTFMWGICTIGLVIGMVLYATVVP